MESFKLCGRQGHRRSALLILSLRQSYLHQNLGVEPLQEEFGSIGIWSEFGEE